jgi:hypothetical protein
MCVEAETSCLDISHAERVRALPCVRPQSVPLNLWFVQLFAPKPTARIAGAVARRSAPVLQALSSTRLSDHHL